MATKNSRPAKRILVRWNDDHDKELLLWIHYVCSEQGIKIPFDKVAFFMGKEFSEGAVIQHLAKIRIKAEADGLHVPPTFKRGSSTKSTPSLYRARRTSTAKPRQETQLSEDVDSTANDSARGRASREAKIEEEDDDDDYYEDDDIPTAAAGDDPEGEYLEPKKRKRDSASTDKDYAFDPELSITATAKRTKGSAATSYNTSGFEFDSAHHTDLYGKPATQLSTQQRAGRRTTASRKIGRSRQDAQLPVNSEDEEEEGTIVPVNHDNNPFMQQQQLFSFGDAYGPFADHTAHTMPVAFPNYNMNMGASTGFSVPSYGDTSFAGAFAGSDMQGTNAAYGTFNPYGQPAMGSMLPWVDPLASQSFRLNSIDSNVTTGSAAAIDQFAIGNAPFTQVSSPHISGPQVAAKHRNSLPFKSIQAGESRNSEMLDPTFREPSYHPESNLTQTRSLTAQTPEEVPPNSFFNEITNGVWN